MQKDIKMRQLCRIRYFYSDEDLFNHVSQANDYGSLAHLGLIHYLSLLYPEEIKSPKKRKRVSVYHNIQLNITNCYIFCIKSKDTDYYFFTVQKEDRIMFCYNQIFKINYNKNIEMMIIQIILV